jgi:hypothetical protein
LKFNERWNTGASLSDCQAKENRRKGAGSLRSDYIFGRVQTRGDPPLRRTGGAVFHPFFHCSNKLRSLEWRKCAAVSGIPSPADQIIGRHVREDLRESAATILLRVFQLAAKLSGASPNKNHFHLRRRQSPLGISRRHVGARKIRVLMTSVAGHPINAATGRPALDVLGVHMAIVALQWSIARRMTILAARRNENRISALECRARRHVVGRAGMGYRGPGISDGSEPEPRYGGKCRFFRPRNKKRAGESHQQKCSENNPFCFIRHLRTLVVNRYAERKSSALIGSRRTRFPVAAKIALAIAGATGGTPGSPTPVGCSVLGTIYTSIAGDSNMRTMG